jgi:hypothetical protein
MCCTGMALSQEQHTLWGNMFKCRGGLWMSLQTQLTLPILMA